MTLLIKIAHIFLTLSAVVVASCIMFLMLKTYQYPQVGQETINKWLESAPKAEVQKYVSNY